MFEEDPVVVAMLVQARRGAEAAGAGAYNDYLHFVRGEGNAVMIKAKTAARNPESLRLKGEGHPAHTYNAKHVLRGATIT